MGKEPEKIIGAFMVFIVIAIAGWMMLDIDMAKPLGIGWLITGVLGAIGILAGMLIKVLGD